jgi:hypothetical protein
MIVGLLGGKLASLGAQSVMLSGLVVKNLYEPAFPGKPGSHYMLVTRCSVPVLLAMGIMLALTVSSATSVLKSIITMGVVWGAPLLLLFLWRRLTRTAVLIQVTICLIYMVPLPMLVSLTPALRQHPALTVMTHERTVIKTVKATQEDVDAHLAASTGLEIKKPVHIEPVSVFFEDGVARAEPEDPKSPFEGLGRFNIEVYLLSLAGIDVSRFSPGMLLTTRLLMNALVPFSLLIVISLFTRPTDRERLDRFYARLKTPIGASPEADRAAVLESYANPGRFDHTKLFRDSTWEFTKWDRLDTLGFFACCGGVLVVLVFLKAVLLIGA